MTIRIESVSALRSVTIENSRLRGKELVNQ